MSKLAAPKLKTLRGLFIEQLRSMYQAERQLTKALPALAKAAESRPLKDAFLGHLDETRGHVARLDEIFEELDEKPSDVPCKGIDGLVAEGRQMIAEDAAPSVKDAGLIAAAQRVEHYEMAGYGTVRTFAQLLSLNRVADILQETLDEEGEANDKLTELAGEINFRAAEER